MPIKNLIFDLDGTLIDSSSSILASLRGAFEKVGKTPVCPLTANIIGPPLIETLRSVSGLSDPDEIERLATAFKAHYDTEGYKHTRVFSGISEMLAKLAELKLPLFIATNKRKIPTHLILDYLGWTDYFTGIYALDSLIFTTKSDLLNYITEEYSMDRDSTLYVGDRKEDEKAAVMNHLRFAFASWGYALDVNIFDNCGDSYLETPAQLFDYIH